MTSQRVSRRTPRRLNVMLSPCLQPYMSGKYPTFKPDLTASLRSHLLWLRRADPTQPAEVQLDLACRDRRTAVGRFIFAATAGNRPALLNTGWNNSACRPDSATASSCNGQSGTSQSTSMR